MDNNYKNTILYIDNLKDVNKLVQLFELIESKLNIDTISNIAKKEGKSFNGIKNSNQYYKTKVGSQKLAVIGINNFNLPF